MIKRATLALGLLSSIIVCELSSAKPVTTYVSFSGSELSGGEGGYQLGNGIGDPLPDLSHLSSVKLSVDMSIFDAGTVIGDDGSNANVTLLLGAQPTVLGIDLQHHVKSSWLGSFAASSDGTGDQFGESVELIWHKFLDKGERTAVSNAYSEGATAWASFYDDANAVAYDPTNKVYDYTYFFDYPGVDFNVNAEIVTNPEPGIAALFGLGACGLSLMRRRLTER